MSDDMEVSKPVANKVRGKFFKGEDDRDYVHITIIGDPCDVIHKVRPEHTVQFAPEWAAYQSGNVEAEIDGTPLTEVPGIDKQMALAYRLKGIRTADELAALDEAAAGALGLGGLTFWKSANLLMKVKRAEAMEAMVAERPRRGRPPNPPAEEATTVA